MLLDGVHLQKQLKQRRISRVQQVLKSGLIGKPVGPLYLSPLGLKELTQDVCALIGKDARSYLCAM